jgi:pyrroline-5-carboxylate reductase
MAQAIISGSLNAGILDSALVSVLDPNQDQHQFFKNAYSKPEDALDWLLGESRNREKDEVCIVLAVKPQMLEIATQPLVALMDQSDTDQVQPLVISILAGTTNMQVDSAFKGKVRTIRVMPNTPAQIGMGMSAISASEKAREQDIELAECLFGSIGQTIKVDENLMDAFTAIAGSGPAYIFYLAEAMCKAAQELGFSSVDSLRIVKQTVLGSASLLSGSEELPEGLRAKVTSKNGTTYAATSSLDDSGVMDSIIKAITAARDRGQELGQEE